MLTFTVLGDSRRLAAPCALGSALLLSLTWMHLTLHPEVTGRRYGAQIREAVTRSNRESPRAGSPGSQPWDAKSSHRGTDSPKSPGVRGAGAAAPSWLPWGGAGQNPRWMVGPPDGSFIPRSSSRGERGDTGRPLRGGTRGCARWRVPSARITTTCTHLHFIERVGPPSWRMLVGGKASASSFGLFPLTLGGLLASLWPGVGLAGLLRWGLGMAGEFHHKLPGGFHASGPRPRLGRLVQAQRSNWWASRLSLHQLPPGTKEVASYRCLFSAAPDTSVKYRATASVNFILKPFSVLFPICPKGWYPCPADSSRQGEQS